VRSHHGLRTQPVNAVHLDQSEHSIEVGRSFQPPSTRRWQKISEAEWLAQADWAMAGLQSGALSSSVLTGTTLQHAKAAGRQQTRLIPSADFKAGLACTDPPPQWICMTAPASRGVCIGHRPPTVHVLQVRPYTVRKGDTLASIAQKREVPLDQLLKLNHK
jgi:LysM domain